MALAKGHINRGLFDMSLQKMGVLRMQTLEFVLSFCWVDTCFLSFKFILHFCEVWKEYYLIDKPQACSVLFGSQAGYLFIYVARVSAVFISGHICIWNAGLATGALQGPLTMHYYTWGILS